MPLNIKDLKITSADFQPLGRLRDEHAGDKGNVVPRLSISGVPAGTKELALICHDPDAPLANGFTHWVVYGIDPSTTDLSDTPEKFRVGPNGAGDKQYYGPQPPAGHGEHHYYFWIYALDTKVEGTPTREEFLQKYAGNIIEQNRIVGIYENK
ncbi:MAG: YbhB/YbcL family Raf kinase inhibitor-like protein [Mesorhizobium sp.]|uniref:YbhB/YbcL family Raf kinase inhibitor-like protein n=1 Tax=Mesorhizobium sp. TaxID=1871066 RepID=UPI000FE7E4E5|nr:YbhB/YbcL family Raf kinase inhibitor-like protein [Mesorhizobium sp.]RWB71118.1 MAG: YbhB/YbcL family Raf kinase inhibitor-like protein [Mesorhizobium sp.]